VERKDPEARRESTPRLGGGLETLTKKNIFQIHQVYFTKQDAPRGRGTKSSTNFMIHRPEKVRVFVLSADMNP